ncbi:hypothetical protein K458DRAFT_423469 [Lentithecium fluviatile CBS 122367]|uniref:Uncharacterized protein n=1 Tax=Lentithecium fluviatile CBS 122367 TaxID=1168545 RepID=A0A6G1IJD9_9PLEO|nr:hypothetical protein K458DRAFT_423469 [Lentithecium fluviatile CBS 122367]
METPTPKHDIQQNRSRPRGLTEDGSIAPGTCADAEVVEESVGRQEEEEAEVEVEEEGHGIDWDKVPIHVACCMPAPPEMTEEQGERYRREMAWAACHALPGEDGEGEGRVVREECGDTEKQGEGQDGEGRGRMREEEDGSGDECGKEDCPADADKGEDETDDPARQCARRKWKRKRIHAAPEPEPEPRLVDICDLGGCILRVEDPRLVKMPLPDWDDEDL